MQAEKNSAEARVLEKVSVTRRGFVKSLTLGTAFAVPMIASFSMDGLRANTAMAGILDSANETGGFFQYLRRLVFRFLRYFGGGSKNPV